MGIRGNRGVLALSAAVAALLLQAPPAAPDGAQRPACRHAATPVQELSASGARSALRCLVAARRRDRGLPALRPSASLQRMARELARDMLDGEHRTHTTTSGETLGRRAKRHLSREFRSRWELGEAVAWGSGAFATPAALMDTLVRSPPHRRLLDNHTFRLSDVALAGRGDTAVAVVEVARLRRSR